MRITLSIIFFLILIYSSNTLSCQNIEIKQKQYIHIVKIDSTMDYIIIYGVSNNDKYKIVTRKVDSDCKNIVVSGNYYVTIMSLNENYNYNNNVMNKCDIHYGWGGDNIILNEVEWGCDIFLVDEIFGLCYTTDIDEIRQFEKWIEQNPLKSLRTKKRVSSKQSRNILKTTSYDASYKFIGKERDLETGYPFIPLSLENKENTFSLPIVNQEKDSLKILLSHSMDSIVIRYWNSRNAREYLISIFNNTENILIREYFSGKNVIIDSLELIKSLVTYINDFYIDKTKNIILQKRRTNIMVSSDWPSIEVIGYKKGIKIFDKHIWLTEEYDDYRIVFNPEFLEFCELIKLLANYVDKESHVRCK